MDTAEQIVRTVDPSEVLPWATGRIVGHGPTRREAFDPIRTDLRYATWTVVFTGKSKKPLRRPPVFFD